MANADHNCSHQAPPGVLDQDVGCPQCGYNLRGLGSDDVVCPECGLGSNVAQLMLRKWDKPWYRAPKYNTICIPAAVVLLGMLGWLFTLAFIEIAMSGGSGMMITTVWIVGGLTCWIAAMAWIWQKMDGVASACFALLAHVPIVGYLASLVLFLGGLIMAINSIADFDVAQRGPEWPGVIGGIIMLIGGIGVFALSRWIERLVASHCIRLYLRRPTTSG